jgi:hypothetical protein
MNSSKFLQLFFKAILFSLISCNNNKNDKPNDDTVDSKDYISVSSILTPIIADSLEKIFSYDIYDDKAYGCHQDRDKEQIKSVSSKFKFYNPLQITNLKVENNYPETFHKRTYYLNDSTIGIIYHMKCNRRIIIPPGHPPPPPNPNPGPPNTIKIHFDVKSKYKDLIATKTLNNNQKSSTLTVFISEYKDFPATKTYQVLGWKYSANIKIYRKGKLIREYHVSDEIPQLQKVTSYILAEKKLVIEVFD